MKVVYHLKQINAALLAMSAAAGIGLLAGMLNYEVSNRQIDEPYETGTVTVPARASVRAEKPNYILGEKDGRVAVYLYGKDDPEIVFNVYLHHLPDVDRENLREGIEIADYQTLLTLIEDYTS